MTNEIIKTLNESPFVGSFSVSNSIIYTEYGRGEYGVREVWRLSIFPPNDSAYSSLEFSGCHMFSGLTLVEAWTKCFDFITQEDWEA